MNATPKCQDEVSKKITEVNRSPCTRLAFVAIASSIAKRNAAASLQRSCSANDPAEGPMLGARISSHCLQLASDNTISICDRLRMRIIIQ
jgi:hypothetical protein